MNLFYEAYPRYIESDGERIPIHTDFRDYIHLIDLLKSKEATDEEKGKFVYSLFLEEPKNVGAAVAGLMDFASMKALGVTGSGNNAAAEEPGACRALYSFQYDYAYILAGFLQSYQIDLNTIDYMHWWKFRSLFNGLPADTEIKQRINYRSMNVGTIKNKDERKRIRKIQERIRLPEEEISDYEIGNAFM